MISSARDSMLTSQYNAAAASDATFGTTGTTIAAAETAGLTTTTITNPSQACINYLMSRGYEVRQTMTAGVLNPGVYEVDWTNPTDANL